MKKLILIGLLALLSFTYACSSGDKISSFEECVAGGYAVMESYPRQCRVGDQVFIEEIAGDGSGNAAYQCTAAEKSAEACTMEYAPVCGDDGVTYGNKCGACASGSVDYYTFGECPGPIGGQRDEYGCLGPAGYSYDSEVGACTRSWELDSSQKMAAKLAVGAVEYSKGITITEVQVKRCAGCFDVMLEKDDQRMQVLIENWQATTIGMATDSSGNNGLSYSEAVAIAEASDCVASGRLTDVYVYNENTKTWWIDLEMDEPDELCHPACVVSEESLTAEINWRCTGLVR